MNRTKLLLLSLVLCGGVFVLDQWTKAVFMKHEALSIWGTVLQTTSHRNMGLMADVIVPQIAIILVTTIVAGIVGYALCQSISKQHTLRTLSLALILGGALGNLVDRIRLGYVFDWILLFNYSILNIADIAIGLGIILILTTL